MKFIEKIPKPLRALLALLFWLGVWYLAANSVSKEVLLPSPDRVFERLFELIRTEEFYKTVFASVVRITTGFAIAALAGLFLGILSSFSAVADSLLSPLLSVVKATPVASFIILALVWLNKSMIPVFISLLMVLPVIYGNVKAGVENTDKDLLEMAKVYKLGRGAKLMNIYIPSIASYFKAGLFTCTGLAWKAGVAAEVLCTPKRSIGIQLHNSKTYLDTADLFAWTLTIVIISVVIEKLLKLLLRGKDEKTQKAVKA